MGHHTAFTVALLVALVTAERDPAIVNGNVYRNSDNMRWRGQMRLGNLQTAMDRLSSSLDTALDRLTDRIEQQVEDSLPLWMRTNNRNPESGDAGIEAIGGNLGDGIDDGLKVHFEGEGDSDVERVEGVRVEEPWEVTAEGEEDRHPDQTPAFSFNPFFPFGKRPGFNGFNMFDVVRRRRSWWTGPNVCVDREEIDEGKESEDEAGSTSEVSGTSFFSFGTMEVTSCSETRDKYVCSSKSSRRGLHKTVIVTYRCCHGYVKEDSGCTRVELHEMPETLQKIGATDFLSLTKAIGMNEIFRENMTLFVPTNEAMQEYTADMEAENELDNTLDGDRSANEVYFRRRRSADTQALILSHMTKGIFYASDLHDEQVLHSMVDNSTLRINTYSTNPPAATVNCARLVSVNQHSTHGVVHTIDRVLEPVTKSLADLISSDPQFSVLKRLVSKAGLLTRLREPGQLTVFAPTDAAFQTLPEPVLEALIEGGSCLDSVVKNHILPNVICSAAAQGKSRTVNLLENYLLLEKTEEDKIFVEENAQVVARDIIGTNGVLHIIDSPLMPQEAKPVTEVLEGHNLTRFLDLLEAAGMTDELTGLTDVTVFAPSNRAIDEVPTEILDDLMSNPSKLREILSYHMATPSLQANDIANDHMATTRANHPLRINLYSRTPLLSGVLMNNRQHNVRLTAGCSRVSMLDSRACGAVVHIVEKMLKVPKDTVMQHLEDNEFSIFTKMLKDTGLNETLSEEGPFTVLAPTDHVFLALPQMELKKILEDQKLQEVLIKQHVLKEHVCCAGINPSTWLFMDHKQPMDGTPIHVRRINSGRLMAGHARITHCSAPTLNGLVHTVNHLLINIHPQQQPNVRDRNNRPIFSAPGFEIFFG